MTHQYDLEGYKLKKNECEAAIAQATTDRAVAQNNLENLNENAINLFGTAELPLLEEQVITLNSQLEASIQALQQLDTQA